MGNQRRDLVLLLLAFAGFVSLGMPDGILGVAAPAIRTSFGLPLDAIGALLVAFMTGYLASSTLAGWLLDRLGVGPLLAVSVGLTGVTLAGYAAAPAWWAMVALAPVGGLGAGAIDASLNAWVAARHGPRILTWLHASYGIGTASGPVLMTILLGAGRSWRVGYALVAGAQLLLALAFAASRERWAEPSPGSGPALSTTPTRLRDAVRLPSVWSGAAAFFLYTGIEAAAGLWTFTLLTEGRGLAVEAAGTVVWAYWTAFTLGRVAAGALVTRVGTERLLHTSLLAVPASAALVWLGPDATTVSIGVVLLGAACAPIFPAMMALTSARVGSANAAHAVGLQVAGATLGQQLLPAGLGVLAARSGLGTIGAGLLVASLGLLALERDAGRARRAAAEAGVRRVA